MKQRQWKPRGRLRRILGRSSLVWWTSALILGAITATVAGTNVSSATRAADAWGTPRQVWIVKHAVVAGGVMGASDVVLATRPKGVVPSGALGASSSPVGEATRVAVHPGEVVLTARLAGPGSRGLAAMVPANYRAIAVKLDDAMPSLRSGDRVDVIATFEVADDLEPAPRTATDPSFAVASDAEVLTVTSKAVIVAVRTREVARVAFALARAAVTLALRGS